MREAHLFNERGELIAGLRICTSLWEGIRGLLGRPEPGPAQGLLLAPCHAVHTIGMRYPIDVVFLDRDDRVVRVVEALKPLRQVQHRKAKKVIEFKAGEAARLGIHAGCVLDWR